MNKEEKDGEMREGEDGKKKWGWKSKRDDGKTKRVENEWEGRRKERRIKSEFLESSSESSS